MRGQGPRQADRVPADLACRLRLRLPAGVEHQVQRVQHRDAARRQEGAGGQVQAFVAPCGPCASQSLGECNLVGQQPVGDHRQVETPHRPQGECHLRRRRQGRMACRKEQREFVVVELAAEALHRCRGRRQQGLDGLVVDGHPRRVVAQRSAPRPRPAPDAPGRTSAPTGPPAARDARAAPVPTRRACRRARQGPTASCQTISMRRISIHWRPRRCGQLAARASACSSSPALTMNRPPITSLASA